MKLEDAVLYVANKAVTNGYTEKQISLFIWEVTDKVNSLPDCSIDELDKLHDELF